MSNTFGFLPIQVPDPAMFSPRDYQLPFWEAVDTTCRFALLIWHRRAGKDWCALNKMAQKIAESWDTPGDYVYFAGESAKQAQKITGSKTNDGVEYLAAFPPQMVLKKDEREGTITFKNGSKFHIMSTLSPDAARGMNIKGVIFSEADFIPGIGTLWAKVVFPMLNQNGGWAYFVSTPEGMGFIYRLYTANQDDPDWFCEIRDIYNTPHNGERTFTDRMLELARKNQTEAEIQQEYMCDFFAESGGTFYEKQFKKIREEGRVCKLKYEPALPVHTFWDLGIDRDDPTVIWFAQIDHMGMWRFIDFHLQTDQPLVAAIKVVKDKPYAYGVHFAPHDMKVRDLVTGTTRLESAFQFGIRFHVTPRLPIMEGINAGRLLLDNCFFDSDKCSHGIEALKHYKKKVSPHSNQFGQVDHSGEPVHDWASHPADAFRVAAVNRTNAETSNYISSAIMDVSKLPSHANTEYDVFGTGL